MTRVTAAASDGAVPEQRGDGRSGASDREKSADGRGERPLERADRNMIEMLQELRVAQTGVQILFAFLLSLSFTGSRAWTTSSAGPTSRRSCSPR